MRAFLTGSGEVRFAEQRREEVYGWVEQTLVRHHYAGLDRAGESGGLSTDQVPGALQRSRFKYMGLRRQGAWEPERTADLASTQM